MRSESCSHCPLPNPRAVSNFSSSDQQAMQGIIEQKQMKDFMRLYTGLVERCFDSCCNDFTSKALSSKEVRGAMAAVDEGAERDLTLSCSSGQETCVESCTQKWLKHSERVGARFQEENAKMMQSQQPR